MTSRPESFFTISFEDLDKTLLPEGAQDSGSEAFKKAVTDLICSEYEGLGGQARVVIDDNTATIHVTWLSGDEQADPLQVAVSKLEKGDREEAIRLLEILRFQQPQRAMVFYNLGLALSDIGRLDESIQHLRRALALAPGHANTLVGLGVAFGRQNKREEAIQSFRQAIDLEPDNPWAHRDIGACLLMEGKAEEAEAHLRRAVKSLPTDQQSMYGLGKALLILGHQQEADELLKKVIAQDDRTKIAELAKVERSKLAESSLRSTSSSGYRMDAVMYCLDALEKFAGMPRQDVQKIALEIAIMGQNGLDTNDSAQKYTLRSLPGKFSGLNLVSIMYVAFKAVAPEHDIRFDLSREYQAALALHKKPSG